MPLQHYSVGSPGNDYADAAAMRTAGNAFVLAANDLNVIFWVTADLTLAGSATFFSNPTADATHRILVMPAPGLGYADLHPGGFAWDAPSGIRITANATASNNGLPVGRGWGFEGFRWSVSAAGTAAAIFFNQSNNALYSSFKRNIVVGNLTTAHIFSSTHLGLAATRELEVTDNRFINTASSSSAAAVRVQRGTCFERNTVYAGGAYLAAIGVGVSGVSPLVRDNAFYGSIELNRTTGTADGAAVNASTNNYTAGTFSQTGLTTSTLYAEGNFHPNYAPADLFASVGADLRPKAAGPLIGAASSASINTVDMCGRNRGVTPDVGASQLTAAPALAEGTITTTPPDGQNVALGGTVANAASGTVALVGSTATLGPITIDIASGAWTSAGFTSIPAGTYIRRLRLLNSQGVETVIDGESLIIDPYTGSPENPELPEPEGPPVVSDVAAIASSHNAATVRASTTKSGGTMRAVLSASATTPTTAAIDTGTGFAATGSQAATAAGERTITVAGAGLVAGAVLYPFAYHDHPDGKSLVVGGSVITMPAQVFPPSITTQPSDITVDDGDDAVFTMEYAGTEPITVRVWIDGVDAAAAVISGSPGARLASYTIADADADDIGKQVQFHLQNVVTAVTSEPAVLSVNAPVVAPTITDEFDDLSIPEGGVATFFASATTGGGTLAWSVFSRPAGDTSDGAAISGQTTPSYTTAALALSSNGRQYRPRVINEAGVPVFGRWATVTVTAVIVPPEITQHPQNVTRNVGQTATFSVQATGTEPFIVDWYVNGGLVSGVSGASFTTLPLLAQDSGAQVHCVVKNDAGEAVSDAATLTVVVVATPPVMSGPITFSELSHLGYRATWPAATNSPTRYELALNGGAWADIGLALSRLMSGRTPESTDALQIRAINGDGPSNVISNSVTLLATPPTLPPGPGGRITGISSAQLFSLLAAAGANDPADVSPLPVATAAPVITGTARVGLVATVTPGLFTNAPTSRRYVYKRNGTIIGGATNAPTYGYVQADVGAVITVEEYASNLDGESVVPAVSAPTAQVAAAAAQGGDDMPASVSQLFSQVVASRTPAHAYTFGTAAAAAPALVRSHVINSLQAATAAFDSFQDFTGQTTINSEGQRYKTINAETHKLAADRMGLWALLQAGETWEVPFDAQIDSALPTYVNGTATPWANLPNTANFGYRDAMLTAEVGQWVALINRGMARVAAINPGVSVTLAAVGLNNTSNHVNQMQALMPIQSTVCQTYTNGTTTLTFAPNSLSTKIRPGWAVARVNPGGDTTRIVQMSTDVRVLSVDRAAGVVIVDRSIPYSDIPGSRVVFFPHIAAGQLWTRDLFDIRPERSWFAVEWDVDIFPGFSTLAAADLPRTGSRHDLRTVLNNFPDIPAGAWPALWGYSGDDGSAGVSGSSEMDMMELFMSLTMGNRLYSTGNISDGPGGVALYNRMDNGWTLSGSGKNRMAQADGVTMVGRHKIQYLYGWELTNPSLPEDPITNPIRGVSWHYLDNLLIHKETFEWRSQRQLQLGMNIAMAWLSRSGASNFQFPFRTTNFNRANMDLLSMKVWCRSGPAA